MSILFWALQIILAIELLTVTFNHGLRPDPARRQRGRLPADWNISPRLLHYTIRRLV